MEELFDSFARVAGSLVEAVAVLTVFYGSVEAFITLVPVAARPRTTHGQRKAIWRRYGVWLLLGLEFELAADIIGSVVIAIVAGGRQARGDRRHPNVSELLPRAGSR